MTDAEEESLLKWILSLDQRGACPQPCHIQVMADILLAKRGFSTPQHVGVNWASKFIDRHPEIKSCFSQSYSYQRAKCEDPKIIKEWFNRVQIVVMQNGIAFEDIYNFDETGYAMGLVATAKVVTRAGMVGRPQLLQPGNCEWVTSIECVSSTGYVLPPCIIFKGKVHIEGWYEDGALPDDWRIEVSENGWTTDAIGLHWLKHIFIPATETQTIGRYHLLVLDGHGSHLTPDFDDLCSANNIIPICMPANSSHLLQPLDVACFSPLKHAYHQLVEDKTRLGFNHIDKFDFLEAYPCARNEAFKPETVHSGFSVTGLVPYDPERVLSQLSIHLATPMPPPSQSTNSLPKTPHNLRQLNKQASTIKKLLRDSTNDSSSSTGDALNQLIKGCELAMSNAVLLAKENSDLRAAHDKAQLKRKRSRRQIARAEGLSVQEARALRQGENRQSEVQEGVDDMVASSTVERAPRAPPRCGNCQTVGHRRNHCPNRDST